MEKKIQKERAAAVRRFIQGENPGGVCPSMGKSRRWLYKWVARHTPDDPGWYDDQSRKPLTRSHRTPAETEEIVEMVRLSLYNKDLFCGNQAIQWELKETGVKSLCSP